MRGSGAFDPGTVAGVRVALGVELRGPGVPQALRELQAGE